MLAGRQICTRRDQRDDREQGPAAHRRAFSLFDIIALKKFIKILARSQ
jgi:hypothetical protein